jgi:hypothetical protein
MTKRTQNIVTIAAALLVLVVSVLVTLYFSGAFSPKASPNYQNITMTDARLACEERMHRDFGSDLSNYFLDAHSSRHDSAKSLYKIFLQAYTENSDHEITEFFITCYVRSRNGRVSKFEVFENKEQKEGEAIRRGGDKFIEWPQ